MKQKSFADFVYAKTINSKIGRRSAISSSNFLNLLQGFSWIFPEAQRKNHKILEIGAGIGTCTRILIKCYKCDVVCYELNDFCLLELDKIRSKLLRRNRLLITNDVKKFKELNFFSIIIDGPIKNFDLFTLIKNSSNLKFILIENYRLYTRLLVGIYLKKNGFRQQYIEFRIDQKPIGAIFLVEKPKLRTQRLHMRIDFFLTICKILPRLVTDSLVSRGRILRTGHYVETGEGVTKRKL